MTLTGVRDTLRVTETQWERLYRLVERRRKVLGLTLDGLQAIGGPSPRWVQKLRGLSGEPTDRMRRPMRNLDAALGWRQDTTWDLVAHDRSAWSEVVLQDEEEQLMEQVDEADEFVLVVASRLRALPAGPVRDEAMRRILDALDVRP